uniref:Copper transporter n=1 Tax=Aegilops tauschii subsp. strangulata TaxID=200361 RepID=A0A453ELA7_AEGTS
MVDNLKPVALFLLMLNLCMYLIIAIIGGWAVNLAIDRGFIIGTALLCCSPGTSKP